MRTRTLAEVCSLLTDGTHYTPPDVGSGVPFLTVKDVTDSTLDFMHSSRISADEYRKADAGHSAPKLGDVLFSKDGTVGKVHVVRTDQPFAVLSSLAILRPDVKQIDADYLGHALRTPMVVGQATERKTGSAIRRIVLSDLKQISFPVPPLEEQRRIAAILDQADALRAKRREVLAHLDDLTQSIFLDMFGDPLRNDAGWAIDTVGGVVTRVTDGEHQTPRRSASGTKLLSARNVQDGYIDCTNVDFVDQQEYDRIKRRIEPRVGDVLISCSGTIGRVARVTTDEPFAMVRSVALVRTDSSVVLPTFLEHQLRTSSLRSRMLLRANASSQANLFQGQIRELPLIVPPVELQNEFSKRVHALAELRTTQLDQLEVMEGLFASLQSRVFAGEL